MRSKRRSARPSPPITCLSPYYRPSLLLVLAGIIIFISTIHNNPIIPTVSASVAALDMTRGFSDHPLRGVDSSRRRPRRHYQSSNKSALLSSWRMLHRPAEFVWRQELQRRRVSPAHASPALSSLDALLSSRRRGGRRTIHTSRTTQLASSNQKKQDKKNTAQSQAQPQAPPSEQYSYDDLTLLGRTIAGTVEIAFTVLIEYVTGFVGGYALGGITDVPRFLTQSALTGQAANNPMWWRELAARTSRMHVKSARWGRSWAGISAAFGGFRVTVRVLRNGKEDEWNTVLSSMAAGAFFARNGV